jgi:hypothetical protein
MLPATRAASATPSARVGVSGFWQRASMPRSAAISTTRAWVSRGEAMSTASARMPVEHRLDAVVGRGNAEFRRPLPGALDLRIADRDDLGTLLLRPGDEVVIADHAGPDEADLQARAFLQTPRACRGRRHAGRSPKPNKRTAFVHRIRLRPAASGSQRSIAAGKSA